ncbi:DUF3558 domain-containing protein [Nocardia sp. NPDC050697]|uniref:DUF3558 domain-containing protein n=1 Tax=Nocardia sp. NPDC050697 TaxID=3155158 RepID=UPI0034022FB1
MRFGTAALAALTVFFIAGCDSSGGSGTSSTSPATPTGAPTAFDPCADIPQSLLDSEGLRNEHEADDNAGGIQWRGCDWVQVDGYAASIQTTNLTVAMVRDKKFADAREFAIGDRQAISGRSSTDRPDEECAVNVSIQGGSLEVGLTNPDSSKKTGHLDTCELARALTEKVVAALPQGV